MAEIRGPAERAWLVAGRLHNRPPENFSRGSRRPGLRADDLYRASARKLLPHLRADEDRAGAAILDQLKPADFARLRQTLHELLHRPHCLLAMPVRLEAFRKLALLASAELLD